MAVSIRQRRAGQDREYLKPSEGVGIGIDGQSQSGSRERRRYAGSRHHAGRDGMGTGGASYATQCASGRFVKGRRNDAEDRRGAHKGAGQRAGLLRHHA